MPEETDALLSPTACFEGGGKDQASRCSLARCQRSMPAMSGDFVTLAVAVAAGIAELAADACPIIRHAAGAAAFHGIREVSAGEHSRTGPYRYNLTRRRAG